MKKTSKKKTGAPKKAESDRKKLTPKEKMSVDELCDLWQRVLNYRRALQHRLELHEGKFSNVLDVFGSEDDAKAYTWIDNERGLASAKYDLERFDTRLLQYTKRTKPPDWILTDWLPLPSDFEGIETVNRFAMFVVVDSLEYRAPKKVITGGKKSMVIPAVKAVIDLLKNKQDKRGDIYERRLRRAVGCLCKAATYIYNLNRHTNSLNNLFVDNNDWKKLREDRACADGWNKQANERLQKRKTRLLEIINSIDTTDRINAPMKLEKKHGRYLHAACYVVGRVLGVSDDTVRNWYEKR